MARHHPADKKLAPFGVGREVPCPQVVVKQLGLGGEFVLRARRA